jgi:hypothetical protein
MDSRLAMDCYIIPPANPPAKEQVKELKEIGS